MTGLRGGTNLSIENLLIFKISALLHDPPYKAFLRVIKETISGSLKHEEEARCIARFIASVLSGIGYNIDHSKVRVKKSDVLAAGFDRWLTDVILGGSTLRFRVPFCYCLTNIFNTSILMNIDRNKIKQEFSRHGLQEFLYELACTPYSGGLLKENLEFLHVFETLFEYRWYKLFREAISPADTRAPTHSTFDHLYATAATVNIVAPARSNETIAGLMVGVSVAPLKDWLASSRKLSDLWIASWLASILVWYTVKDLVWCLGPDILLLPGFRWNQLYYALLKEKLGEDYQVVKDFVEGFGFFEDFPYYAWQPAYQVLLLPILRKKPSGGDSACSEVYNKLYSDKNSNKNKNKNNTQKLLNEVKDRIEKYLRDRYRRAWKLVVEAVRENAPGRLRDLIDRLEDLGLLEEPLLELVVVVKKLCVDPKDNKHHNAKKDNERRNAKWVYAEKFNELSAEMEEEEARALPGWARNEKLHDITRRVGVPICPTVTSRIDREIEEYRWRSCSVCKHAPAVLWVPGRDLPDGDVSDDYKEWALRTLCSGDQPVDRETCWRMWRPIFRPGERLCPYCLVKRLLGLNQVFEHLAEKLLGIRPDKEVSFPSTSDVAGLALKIALLELASMIVSGELVIDRIDDDIIKALSVKLERSSIHEDLREYLSNSKSIEKTELIGKIKDLVWKRWWTPKLLWFSVRRLLEEIEKKQEQGGIEDWKLKFAAAVLLFVDSELEEALFNNRQVQEKLRELSQLLRNATIDTGEEKLKIIREALVSPRKYYSIIWFDGDKYGLLKRGILGIDIGKHVDEINVCDYVIRNYISLCKRIVCKRNSRFCELCNSLISIVNNRQLKSCEKLEKIFDKISKIYDIPRGSTDFQQYVGNIRYHGSVIVSPSYHYALANAISYTNLRAAIVAERLGGIPVYMAGDEGLIIAPTWLPWLLLPEKVRDSYRVECRRALRLKELEGLEDNISSNPALTISLLVRRIYWASSSRFPGFHPVKKRGAGRVYWRIPAIVSNGLSMGVRFAHYKDAMYDELWFTRSLLEEAKEPVDIGNDNDSVWVGDSVVLSYGRPGYGLSRGAGVLGKVYAKIPNTLRSISDDIERIRLAGAYIAAVNVLVGLVEKGVVSTSVFNDRILLLGGEGKAESVWRNAFRHGLPHVESLLYYLFDRNIHGRGNEKKQYLDIIGQVFSKILETTRTMDPDLGLILLEELFNASDIALKSMRTV